MTPGCGKGNEHTRVTAASRWSRRYAWCVRSPSVVISEFILNGVSWEKVDLFCSVREYFDFRKFPASGHFEIPATHFAGGCGTASRVRRRG